MSTSRPSTLVSSLAIDWYMRRSNQSLVNVLGTLTTAVSPSISRSKVPFSQVS